MGKMNFLISLILLSVFLTGFLNHTLVNPVHIGMWGVYIKTPSGQVVGAAESNSTVSPGTKTDLNQNISISDPVLWSADNPKLYNARV